MSGEPPTTTAVVDFGDSPTLVEQHAIEVAALFPSAVATRTLDVIQLDIEGERGCTVVLTSENAEIRLPTIEWVRGAYEPRESSRYWSRVRLTAGRSSYDRLLRAIEAAIEARRAEFRKCVFCGSELPPEHMTDDACHSCASAHRGIVY